MIPIYDPGRLTSEDILRLMQVPGWPRLFVLSPFEQPVNVMSQQIRAINLVHALLDTGILLTPASAARTGEKPRARLSVIGAGVAGTTAAAYAALRGCTVEIFERNGAELRLFANSERYLDPVLYDWPEIERGQRAAIPVMSWTGDVGKHLTTRLYEQWRGWKQLHDIAFYPNAQVELPEAPLDSMDGELEISFRDAHHAGGRQLKVDALILAVGFGPEKPPENPELKRLMQRFRYWDREKDPVWLRPSERTALISGTGDGGLTDLFWLAIRDFNERMLWEIIEVLKAEKVDVAERVSRIEREIRLSVNAGLADVSKLVTSRYMTIETPNLDAFLWQRLQSVDITLNGTESEPLTDKSYPINRFLTSRLFRLAQRPLDGSRRFSLRYLRGRLECWKTDEGIFAYDTRQATPVNGAKPFSTVVIRRGPSHVLAESFPLIYQRCKEVQHRTRLGLTRRAVWPAPYVAHSFTDDLPSNPLGGVVRRHILYSDLFDSTVQRAVYDQVLELGCEGGADLVFRTLYLGRLRLGLLMHGTILLTDTQVLDGAFFLTLTEEEIRLLAPRTVLKLREETVAETTRALLTDKNGLVRPFEISAIRDAAVRAKVRDWMRSTAPRKTLAPGAGVDQILEITRELALDEEALDPLVTGWRRWHSVLTEMSFQRAEWSSDPFDLDQQVVDPGRLFADLSAGKDLFERVYKQRKTSRTNIYRLLSEGLADDRRLDHDAWKIRSFYNSAYNAGIARKEGANVIETVWVDGAAAFGVECEFQQAAPSRLGGLVGKLGSIEARSFEDVEESVRRSAHEWRRGLLPFAEFVDCIQKALEHISIPSRGDLGKVSPPSPASHEQRRWMDIAAGMLADDAFVAGSFVPHNLDKGDASPRFVTGQWSKMYESGLKETLSPVAVTYYDRSLWRAPQDASQVPDWLPEPLSRGAAPAAKGTM